MGLRFSGLKMANPSESEIMSTTILVDVQLQRTDAAEHDASLQELRQLIETLGWKIAGTLTQKMSSVTAASLIGPGKLEELRELVKAPPEVDSVVFDHELTTTQVRNIREATGVDVYDRPAIILEIFHRHARTKEAQLQVELARLQYLAPRERVAGAKERRGGGRGARGVSESFHELERRQVRDRIRELQRELDAVHTEQVERRRHREGLSKVAIVGYTNAGKSSLMRALTSSDVLVVDQLSLPSIRRFARCNRKPNLASSSPMPLVLFETFRMSSGPHFDRLSTKRWMLRFCFMSWMHLIHRCALTFKSREQFSRVSAPENSLRFSS